MTYRASKYPDPVQYRTNKRNQKNLKAMIFSTLQVCKFLMLSKKRLCFVVLGYPLATQNKIIYYICNHKKQRETNTLILWLQRKM